MIKIIKVLLFLVYLAFSFNLMSQNKTLTVGDRIPNFTLKDQKGNDFSIDKVIGKKTMVIYFYPKNDTPGCTKEACAFRDEFEEFKDLNAVVIGISSDNVNSHKKFSDKYNLPFVLLADTEKKVQKMFGVPKSFLGLISGRVTYVVAKNGEIKYIFNSMSKVTQHIIEAKKMVKTLNN